MAFVGLNGAAPILRSYGNCRFPEDLNLCGTPPNTSSEIGKLETTRVAAEGARPYTCRSSEIEVKKASILNITCPAGGGVSNDAIR